MGKGLNRTELTGVILLVLVVAGIIATAFIMRQCTPVPRYDGAPGVEIIDGTSTPDEEESAGRNSGNKTRKKSTRRKSGRSKGSPRAVKEKTAPEVRDPFADTIPLDWDEE